jgi:hypothetical protein
MCHEASCIPKTSQCCQHYQSVCAFLFQGKLSGYGVEEKLPTIAIVAYYDSFGVAPVSSTPYCVCASMRALHAMNRQTRGRQSLSSVIPPAGQFASRCLFKIDSTNT